MFLRASNDENTVWLFIFLLKIFSFWIDRIVIQEMSIIMNDCHERRAFKAYLFYKKYCHKENFGYTLLK